MRGRGVPLRLSAEDQLVIDVHDKIADIIEDFDPKAAEITRRAIRLFVEERDITFDEALVALFGQATTHRERADITRTGELLRRLADGLREEQP